MPNIPSTIPTVVFIDNFSFPSPKFSTKTHNGDKVEISDAKPLEMNFSAKVVSPFAKTIINIDKIKALNNCLADINSSFRMQIRYTKINEPAKKFRVPATTNGGMVSTAIRIPKKVVPQKKATQNTEK